MNNSILRKPSIYNITYGFIVSILKSIFSNSSDRSRFETSFYKAGKKIYFKKTWNGKIKDFNYYALVNEYIVHQQLFSKITNSKNSYFKLPKIIKVIATKRKFSLVYEYVKGKNLSSLKPETQAEIISNIIINLKKITQSYTRQELDNFSTRGILFYFLSLVLFTTITFSSNRRLYKQVIKAFISCLFSILSLKRNPLYLTHRDLFPGNILVAKDGIYLTDCERTVLTYAQYDLTNLSLNDNYSDLARLISQKIRIKTNKFLSNYILLHLGSSYGGSDNQYNFYTKKLSKLYQ